MSIHRRKEEGERDMKYLEPDEKKKPGMFYVKRDVPLLLVLVLTIIAAVLVFAGEWSGGDVSTNEKKDGISGYLSVAADALDEAEEAAALEEEEEIPFVNIITADSSDLTITWEGLTEKDLPELDAAELQIRSAIDAFAAEGYSAGFMLYDLNSGGGISYHADDMYYSASAIKGPYVAWLVESYPQTMDFLFGTIQNAITWSSNDDYEALITSYGYTEWSRKL